MSGNSRIGRFTTILRSLGVFASTLLLVTAAYAGTVQVLYSFTGGTDGYLSTTGVVMDQSGNLFGVTNFGGTDFDGTIYELTPNGGGAFTYSLIHSFQGSQGNGFANSSLIMDSAGNLYGVAESGGAGNNGTVFELSPGTGGSWTLTVLYVFRGGQDGAVPEADLVMDGAGNLYGVTAEGGDLTLCPNGCGTVFELVHSAGGWTKQEIYRFKGKADGSTPLGGLVFDASGNLYGTTSEQGIVSKKCANGCGTVFRLSPPATGHIWTESILHHFNGYDGSTAVSAVTLDGQGNVYAPTSTGGYMKCASGCGTVVEISPSNGGWTSQVLHAFTGSSDGWTPTSPLILDSLGNLYGATYSGGSGGWGEIYELSPSVSGWTKTELYSFPGTQANGADPGGPLARDAAGNIYGHTYLGGQYGEGVVFEVTP